MRKLLLTVAMLFVADSAGSADLRLPTVPVQPVPAAVIASAFDGFNIGGHIGYSWANVDVGGNILAGSQAFSAFEGGVQLGYGRTFGQLYLGGESDYTMTGLKANGVSAPWYGTTRLKAGFTLTPQWLLYATGGAAYGEVKTTNPLFSTDLMGVGWTVGAGTEFALTRNWSLGLEYLHSQLYGPSASDGRGAFINTSATDDSGRLKVNYRF